MFEYYRYNMQGDEADAYDAVYKCISNHSDEASVPLIKSESLISVFNAVKLDHPEIFYTDKMKYSQTSRSMKFFPEYSFEKAKAEQISQGLQKRVERILSDAYNLDDIKKEKFVHDWMMKNVTYSSLYKNYSHEIYGVLNHGIGVCEGIAKCAKYMFDILSLDSIAVISEANDKNIAHAWNVVYLYGSPKHLDITFDISSNSNRYFNLSDELIYRDHRRSILSIPECK